MTFVFIGGCPRSGTTLLGSMVGAHPDALTIPEAQFVPALAAILEDGRGASPAELAGRLHGRLVADPKFRTWQTPIDRDDLAAALGRGADLAHVLRYLASAFSRSRDLGAEAPRVVVSHAPDHVRHATVLRRHLDDARLVHIVRDGRAVAASFRGLDWGPATTVHAARTWVSEVGQGLALESWAGCPRVRYEDLLTDGEATMRDLAGALGLAFDEAMLSSVDDFLPDYTRRQHARVGGELDRSRIDSWRSVLPDREVEIFEALSHDMLPYLGYERVHAHPRRPTRSEATRQQIANVVGTRARKARRRKRLASHS